LASSGSYQRHQLRKGVRPEEQDGYRGWLGEDARAWRENGIFGRVSNKGRRNERSPARNVKHIGKKDAYILKKDTGL